ASMAANKVLNAASWHRAEMLVLVMVRLLIERLPSRSELAATGRRPVYGPAEAARWPQGVAAPRPVENVRSAPAASAGAFRLSRLPGAGARADADADDGGDPAAIKPPSLAHLRPHEIRVERPARRLADGGAEDCALGRGDAARDQLGLERVLSRFQVG